MGLAFFTPLFLGGLLLLAIPYLIHKIRRPEREPIRFSSLMFIPNVTREIIERRRIQHILLMLLRMLALAALALAFSRPFWKSPVENGGGAGAERHMILLDASYSMGANGHFEEGRRRADAILGQMKPEERVGIIVFASSPRVLAPLSSADDPRAGSIEPARQALKIAELSEDTTAYLPAMQMAQEQLLREISPDGESEERLTLHLISDFQKTGLPSRSAGWRLSPRIRFEAVDVGEADMFNQSIEDLSVRRGAEGKFRIQAKIKNWSQASEHPTDVKLFLGGSQKETASLTIKPGNATQASFVVPPETTGRIEGWIELGPDALALDNRRYFVWSPPEKRKAIIVRDTPPDARRSGGGFLKVALPQGEGGLWELTEITQDELLRIPPDKRALPGLVIATDLAGVRPELADTLLAHVRSGGQLLAVLGDSVSLDSVNSNLLKPLSIQAVGQRTSSARFDLLSWIDLGHPIFAPFQGSRFNDFSQIRFNSYRRIDLPEVPGTDDGSAGAGSADDGPRVKVLARFEADDQGREWPAIVERPEGRGVVVLWAFGLSLEETNLVKNIKFVPVLLETLGYLSQSENSSGPYAIGEGPSTPRGGLGEADSLIIQYPHEDDKELSPEEAAAWEPHVFRRAGFFRMRPSAGTAWQRVEAVNVRPGESDPTRISVADFELRVTSKTPSTGIEPDAGGDKVPEGFAVRKEYWQILLVVLFISLLVESWYAPRLLR